MGPLCRHRTTSRLAATAAASFALLASSAMAQTIPNTGTPSPPPGEENFGNVSAGPTMVPGRLLTSPFEPADADPAEAAAAAALWSPGTPEGDLADALDAMATTGDPTVAQSRRSLALDILEGNAIDKKAYSGIPLLNWNAPAKIKTVPANGEVVITQVRWGQHMVSDTWMLRFDDPDQPFRIRYRVAELGSAFGGQLTPTPLLKGPTRLGQHSAVQPLGLHGNVETGTHQDSRFTDRRGLGAVPEETRTFVQDVTVAMPPAGMVEAILDPNLRAGQESAATLLPATDARIAAAKAAMGFQDGADAAANKSAAIGRLAVASPEKQIWTALTELPATIDAGSLADAKAIAATARQQVWTMRTKNELPAGVAPSDQADATIVLQNNEAYVSRVKVRLPNVAGRRLKVEVVNRDGFTHRMTAYDLNGREELFGAEDWGKFSWDDRDLGGQADVAPGASRVIEVDAAADSFAVWVGDLRSGDQANAVISLDRAENKQEKLELGASTNPVHVAPDPRGNMWVTLAGVDTIARITPAGRLADSTVDRFPLPGGKHEVDSDVAPLAPADITVDGRGIVWATLSSGNAVARIDPSQAQDGTSEGIRILKLDRCAAIDGCRPEVPPVPNEKPTRRPTRIKSMIDGLGNTVLWFTEAGASRIGVLRATEAGEPVDQAHFPCACLTPESLDLGPDGSVWFTQIFENRIGRIRPDATRPYLESSARVDHYKIPRAVNVPDPLVPEGVMTSLPLSIAVDGRNRVWFSESALSAVAWLDPSQAVPIPADAVGRPDEPVTPAGFHELKDIPGSRFRSPAAPADITVDKANNLWWAGEYGDQIEQITPDGENGLSFPGSVRRGMTEGPVADTQGNLWTVETGGQLITRLSGVTAGPLRPFGAPAGFEADTAQNTLSGARLSDTTAVDVRVERGSAVVASATVPVEGGAFDVSGAEWQGSAADPVRPDDVVRIRREGPQARAELSFRVADLAVAVRPDGTLAGTARADGRPLADRVAVSVDGHGGFTADIDADTAAWTVASGRFESARGRVAWSSATVAGTFRTVTPFGPAAEPDPGPQNPGGGSTGGTATGGGATSTPAATTPAPASTGGPSRSTPIAPGSGASRVSIPCRERTWLYGNARRPSVLLIGLTGDQVRTCLGRAARSTAAKGTRLETWTYSRGVAVRFRAGRVVGLTYKDADFRTSRGAAGVGSTLRAIRTAVPALRRDRSGAYVARVGRTDVKVLLDRRGRVRSIDVNLRRAS